jgi:expansin (peptidoglycan-binding protein)
LLERNEAIDGQVQTTYAAPVSGFVPPAPPADPGSPAIRGMGVAMHGTTSGWFARGDGTPAIGSCGFPEVRNLMVTAISHTQFGTSDDKNRFDSAYWCGACAELVGRSGRRVRVMIIDQCTGCDADSLDMPAGANTPFSMMDDPNFNDTCPPNGEQPVDWKIVPCETCGGIVVHYVDGFNAGTPSIQVRNHRLPIVKLEEMHNGSWVQVRRESHNEYYLPRANNEDTQPLQLRITAFDGSTITGAFPVFEPGKTYEASSQF